MKEVYCQACTEANDSGKAVYHDPPECPRFESYHYIEEFANIAHFKVWCDSCGVHAHIGSVGVIMPKNVREYEDAVSIITDNECVRLNKSGSESARCVYAGS